MPESLHHAVQHNQIKVIEHLLQDEKISVNQLSCSEVPYSKSPIRYYESWEPCQKN